MTHMPQGQIPQGAETCNIDIQTKSGSFTFQAEPGETILYAGLRQGLTLPYECATGTCGTCRARVMSGEVESAWEEAPGATKIKRDKGDILMCQSRATQDCVLRAPVTLELRADQHKLPEYRTATIENLRRLTGDVISFELDLSTPMNFNAGQFVVLSAPGLAGGRAYSMVNYQPDSQRIELVVKRLPGGGFSNWLFEEATEGQQLRLFGPLGEATFRPDERKNLLMIAGGSGIAGMMSILAHAERENYFQDHKGHLFFGVRTLPDGFYLEQMARHVAAAGGNLEITLALSHEEAGEAPHDGLQLASGWVHEVAARTMSGRYDNIMAYVAGPPPMVDAALRVLVTEGGLGAPSIRYDKYS